MKKRCTNCGVLNWEVADRCVKCHAFFAAPQDQSQPASSPGVFLKLLIAVFLVAAGYMGYNAFFSYDQSVKRQKDSRQELVDKDNAQQKRERELDSIKSGNSDALRK